MIGPADVTSNNSEAYYSYWDEIDNFENLAPLYSSKMVESEASYTSTVIPRPSEELSGKYSAVNRPPKPTKQREALLGSQGNQMYEEDLDGVSEAETKATDSTYDAYMGYGKGSNDFPLPSEGTALGAEDHEDLEAETKVTDTGYNVHAAHNHQMNSALPRTGRSSAKKWSYNVSDSEVTEEGDPSYTDQFDNNERSTIGRSDIESKLHKYGHSEVKTAKELAEDEAELKELAAKRKAVIAAASRATRIKKKEEMEILKQRHQDLISERKSLRQTIAQLKHQVASRREAGVIDLQMENRLLREELKQHKRFIAQFQRVADGIPTEQPTLRDIAVQGADVALSQVLGLLNTSTIDPSWKPATSRSHPEFKYHYQRVPIGCKRKDATRINIRFDCTLPVPVGLDDFHSAQWKVWSNSALSARLSNHFGNVKRDIKEVDTGLSDSDFGDSRKIKVYYYREERIRQENSTELGNDGPVAPKETTDMPPCTENRDRVFVVTSKREDLPYNALGSEPGVTPLKYPTLVMATTSTQHHRTVAPEKDGVNRIASLLMEGAVARQLSDGQSAFTLLSSYPLCPEGKSSGSSEFVSATASAGWVDDDGYFTAPAEKAISDYCQIFVEVLPPQVVEAYMSIESLAAAFKKL